MSEYTMYARLEVDPPDTRGRYCLYVNTEKVTCSGDPEYKQALDVPPGPPKVPSFAVKDEPKGVWLYNGSVNCEWDDDSEKIKINETSPPKLDYKDGDSPNKFIFTLPLK